jgi:hypothetical protein
MSFGWLSACCDALVNGIAQSRRMKRRVRYTRTALCTTTREHNRIEKCYQHFDGYSIRATTSRRSLDEDHGTDNQRPAMEFNM